MAMAAAYIYILSSTPFSESRTTSDSVKIMLYRLKFISDAYSMGVQ